MYVRHMRAFGRVAENGSRRFPVKLTPLCVSLDHNLQAGKSFHYDDKDWRERRMTLRYLPSSRVAGISHCGGVERRVFLLTTSYPVSSRRPTLAPWKL